MDVNGFYLTCDPNNDDDALESLAEPIIYICTISDMNEVNKRVLAVSIYT